MNFRRGFLNKAKEAIAPPEGSAPPSSTPKNKYELPKFFTPAQILSPTFAIGCSSGQEAPIELFESRGVKYKDFVVFNFDPDDGSGGPKIPVFAYADHFQWFNKIKNVQPLPKGEGDLEGGGFAVRETLTKNQGLFATKGFGANDLIIRERAIILASPVYPRPIANWLYDRQTPAQQSMGHDLYNCHSTGSRSFVDACRTNQIAIKIWQDDDAPEFLGLSPTLAKANHSCGPNACWSFNQSMFAVEVRAVRPVEVDEEITIGYVELLGSRETRRQQLESSYKFLCTCEYCSGTDSEVGASDHRRALAKGWIRTQIDGDLQSQPLNMRGDASIVREEESLIDMMELEGLQIQTRGPLKQLLALYISTGDSEMVKKTARRARRIQLAVHGPEGIDDQVARLSRDDAMPELELGFGRKPDRAARVSAFGALPDQTPASLRGGTPCRVEDADAALE